jgi:alpha-mannosidase
MGLQERARARLCLRWWADAAELLVDGERIHQGDLFDTSCRWLLPDRWWRGDPLVLELRLRSPRHDDGALIHSRLELEPRDPGDPDGLLSATIASLEALRTARGRTTAPGPGAVRVLGHAHLDLAWLWPVADTWRAAERTFNAVLSLMQRDHALHFGHSTPALYAWLEQHRPGLFQRMRDAMQAGRWEPLNGPWVENDSVLIDTPSLLRQYQLGQHYSRRTFPEWDHRLAWLPDSFGFGAGLPAIAHATDVRWFCTHKLAWNATNRFPHRLFRWRSRCGGELLALMTAPIGTDGDPLAIETHRLAWQTGSGIEETLWLPGVGDHGGGPTAEMLEQLALWAGQSAMAPLRHGTLREHLAQLEPHAPRLPVWRDELYLELHRGCATSRPDQKRHNRTLERLLREADLALALLRLQPKGLVAGPTRGSAVASSAPVSGDWRPLLFQQFHDILPGTSIPEVFEQAEPQWRASRRQASLLRDQALQEGLPGLKSSGSEPWWVVQLQPHAAGHTCLKLPRGLWHLASGTQRGTVLSGQPAAGGGQWLQLPLEAGVTALALERHPERSADAGPLQPALAPHHPVCLEPEDGQGRRRLSNGLVHAWVGPGGLQQLAGPDGRGLLAEAPRWCRWRDSGEFWDAWDIAADHRDHPLPWRWERDPRITAQGPLCAELHWQGQCGSSPVRLMLRLLADTPWLELVLSLQWRQRHELLQLELPLAAPIPRWAADTSGGVIERPGVARTPREQARWEVPAISWAAANGLAVLLDGPQGVSAGPQRLSVSLLRAPTWPDPGADNGWQRIRLALLPAPGGWRAARVPEQARRLREPLWCRPARQPQTLSPAPSGAGSAHRDPLRWQGCPPPGEDLRLLGLRRTVDSALPAQVEGSTVVVVSVINEGPCRRWLQLPEAWRVLSRLDGLERPIETSPQDLLRLNPWQLGFWAITAD